MPWTMNGVVISDDRGWTAAANNLVTKIKKWNNGKNNSGPTGYQMKPAKRLARAIADMASTYRTRSAAVRGKR